MNETQLLREYVTSGSENAFRELMGRHLNMVYSVALRQVANPQIAEEVAQAVFILLARKARRLGGGVVLAGWLFRTTRFVAARAIRADQRRRRREQEAYLMQQLSEDNQSWRGISGFVDGALEQLGEADRNAILLRYFEGRNHKEVGVALGMTEEAARKRVARALDRLRGLLAGRGCAITLASLGPALAGSAVQAAPPGLFVAAEAAVSSAVAGSTAIPLLVKETLLAWRWVQIKFAGIAAASTAAIVGLALLASDFGPPVDDETVAEINAISHREASSEIAAAEAMPAVIVSSSSSTARGSVGSNSGMLRLRVIDRDSGYGIPHAALAMNRVVSGRWEQRYDLSTDENGLCHIPLPPQLNRLDVGVCSSGVETRCVTWRPELSAIPAEYILRVSRVTNWAGGWIRDTGGRPIEGAVVWIDFAGGGDASAVEKPRERVGVPLESPVARSDRNGRWSCAVIPDEHPSGFLRVRHPDFPITHVVSFPASDQPLPDGADGEKIRQFRAGTLVTVMEPEIVLSGRVLDEQGRAVAGATISNNPQALSRRIVKSDADGNFRFEKLGEERFRFCVTADGFAPEFREVDVRAGIEPVNVRLKPGAKLKLRVVDTEGFPVADATVGLEQWNDLRYVLDWRSRTGVDGRLEWRSAPPDAMLELYAWKEGWCITRSIRVKPGPEEHTIEMQRALTVSGMAIDAETRQPIEEFKVFPGYGEGVAEGVWERSETQQRRDGRFSIRFTERRIPWRVRVEAEGYVPGISEPIPPDFTGVLNVELKVLNPHEGIRGTVLGQDGRAVQGAEVALGTFEHFTGAVLGAGRFVSSRGATIVKTDADGRFSFVPNSEAHSIVVAHAEGFARMRLKQQDDPIAVRLQPWGRIEGTVLAGDSRGDLVVVLADRASNQYYGGLGFDRATFSVRPDAEGRFSFQPVPPGKFYVYLQRGGGVTFYETPVEIFPGGTAQVRIGGGGWTIQGRLASERPGITNWQRQAFASSLSPLGGAPLPVPASLAPGSFREWEVDFWLSDAGHDRLNNRRSYNLDIAPGGTFNVIGVAPGNYRLSVHVSELEGSIYRDVVVPVGESGLLEIGTLDLKRPR